MVGLLAGRREIVAALAGAAVGVATSLAITPTIGIIAGGIVGPFVGLLVPQKPGRPAIGRTVRSRDSRT